MRPGLKLAGFVLAAALVFAQKRGARDLTYAETPPPNASVEVPRGYALIVGVANYKNLPGKSQLQFSERDADAMYSVLISPEAGNFRAENVHRLTGAKATLANLRQELEVWLPSAAKEDDRVLIYFAGNGIIKDGRAYLAPYDVDPANIPATGYPVDELARAALTKIQARNTILITDACHGGALGSDQDSQACNQSLLDLSASTFSLTASRDHERSIESADWGGGHGIFTYYAVKGLEGEADENADGIVTAEELANYTYRNVREAAKGQQNPADHGNIDPEKPAAYIPAGLRVAHSAPANPGRGPAPDCSAPELSDLCLLLSNGSADEVIRRLDRKTLHTKPAAAALPLLAQAYRMKALYPQAIETARAAIKLAPQEAEPRLWLADSLRLSLNYQDSVREYIEYLRLSEFDRPDSGALDHLRAYLTEAGRKKPDGGKKLDAGAEQWSEVRSVAYSGLCQAERSLMHDAAAIGYCQKSVAYDGSDASTQYALALCYMHEAQANGSLESLAAAQWHFRKALELGAESEEANGAKASLRNIDTALASRP